MKIGDRVRRKQQYQTCYGWPHGNDILIIKSISPSGLLRFYDDSGCWYIQYFDSVEEDIIEKLKKAQDCVGKTIIYAGAKYKLEKVYILPKGASSYTPVETYLKKHDLCIVGEFSTYAIPFDYIEFVKSENLKISPDYTAEIHKDKVVVGCQTIPMDTVREILKISENL